jgi:hypothetical protein
MASKLGKISGQRAFAYEGTFNGLTNSGSNIGPPEYPTVRHRDPPGYQKMKRQLFKVLSRGMIGVSKASHFCNFDHA